MAITKLSIPFLVLTRKRKTEFLKRALKGFRSSEGLRSTGAHSSTGKLDASAAAKGQTSVVHSVSSTQESCTRSAERSSAAISTRVRTDQAAFERDVMPGTRRNSHCLSCCCIECAEIVKIDAEKFFSSKE